MINPKGKQARRTCVTHCLPKRKEYDEFDGRHLQKGFVLSQILPCLDVELNQAIHCDGDTTSLDYHDLIHRLAWIEGAELGHLPKYGQKQDVATLGNTCQTLV